MRLAPPWRLASLLTASLLVAGCLAPHNVPLVNVWVVNTGTEDRVIVLSTGSNGTSPEPSLLIPADGFPRSTPGATLGSGPDSVLSILVYDLDCLLLDSGEVRVGSYLVTLGAADTTISELARSMEPTGAELAASAQVSCTATVERAWVRGPAARLRARWWPRARGPSGPLRSPRPRARRGRVRGACPPRRTTGPTARRRGMVEPP